MVDDTADTAEARRAARLRRIVDAWLARRHGGTITEACSGVAPQEGDMRLIWEYTVAGFRLGLMAQRWQRQHVGFSLNKPVIRLREV